MIEVIPLTLHLQLHVVETWRAVTDLNMERRRWFHDWKENAEKQMKQRNKIGDFLGRGEDVAVAALEWGAPLDIEAAVAGGTYDLVIACDCLYRPADYATLAATLRAGTASAKEAGYCR